jgi:hypothetical protein
MERQPSRFPPNKYAGWSAILVDYFTLPFRMDGARKKTKAKGPQKQLRPFSLIFKEPANTQRYRPAEF